MELPIELISYFMRFLTPSERHEASLVCKRWYYASLDPVLHQTAVITIRANSARDGKFSDLGRRKSPSLVLSHIDGSSTCGAVLEEIGQHLGPHLTSLSLRGSEVTENVFLAIVEHCAVLRRLDLSCCNCLFMSGNLLRREADCRKAARSLEKLTDLNLGTNRYLSDVLFNRLASVTPSLARLSLASCNVVHQSDAYINGGQASGSFLSLSNLLIFLQDHAAALTALDLSRTGIGSEALYLIAHVKGLALQELILKKCGGITDEGVRRLVKKQASLKVLDLSGITGLHRPSLEAVSSHLPSLECLDVSDWAQLEPQASEYLSSLTHLRCLNFSNCYQVGKHFLRKALGNGRLSDLVALNLSGCGSVHDEDVAAIVRGMPQLEQLDLSSCFSVGDPGLHAIQRFLPNLRGLRLAWCKKITDFGLLGLDQDAPVFITDSETARHFSDRFTKSHSNMGFFKLPSFSERISAVPEEYVAELMEMPDRVSLRSLKRLESLDLTACSHLTDVCIRHTIRFPHLRSLNISLCSNITDEGLTAIGAHNPNLTELLLGQCHQISDEGLCPLLMRRRGLRALDICGCSRVTDATLTELGKAARHLKHLNVSQCDKVTAAAAERLQLQVPSLRSLQMAHISSAGSAFYHYQPVSF